MNGTEEKITALVEAGKSTEEICKEVDVKLQKLQRVVPKLMYKGLIKKFPEGLYPEKKRSDDKTVNLTKSGFYINSRKLGESKFKVGDRFDIIVNDEENTITLKKIENKKK